MKSSLVTLFGILSLFVLSGCGDDNKDSQTEPGDGYSLVNAKAETDCTQIEKNLLDWNGWQQANPSQLGDDPTGAGTNCLQINIDETDQDAVSTLNEKIDELNKARTEGQTFCKWAVPSGSTYTGNTYLCKPPSDLTQIKSDFANYYSTRSNNRRCSNTQQAALNTISGGSLPTSATQNCTKMTEAPPPGDNARVVITDDKFNEHINTARSANESLCFWYIGLSNVYTQFLCRVQ